MSEPTPSRRARAPTRSRDLVGWEVDPYAHILMSMASDEKSKKPVSSDRYAEKGALLDSMVMALAEEMSQHGASVSVETYLGWLQTSLMDSPLAGVVDPVDLFSAVMSQYRSIFDQSDWYSIQANLVKAGMWEVDWDMPTDAPIPGEYDMGPEYDDDTDIEDGSMFYVPGEQHEPVLDMYDPTPL